MSSDLTTQAILSGVKAFLAPIVNEIVREALEPVTARLDRVEAAGNTVLDREALVSGIVDIIETDERANNAVRGVIRYSLEDDAEFSGLINERIDTIFGEAFDEKVEHAIDRHHGTRTSIEGIVEETVENMDMDDKIRNILRHNINFTINVN